MTNPDAWMTPQIRDALAKLEEAEVDLDTRVAQAGQLAEQLPKGGLSQEDIQLIEQHARSKDAPRELRELQDRVDRGDLSWQDISAGRFLDDPQVRAALEHGVAGMQSAYTMIREGHELDEIIESGGPAVPTSNPDDGATDTDEPDDAAERDIFRGGRDTGGSRADDRPAAGGASDGSRDPRTGDPGVGDPGTGRPRGTAGGTGTGGAGSRGRDADAPDDDDYFGGSPFR
ncbi:hypothetical protein FB384_002559 [Prauserella sediminis]|uniref:Uncharacterized protein n=1 Tax=Prauserella sediminis TaxID=577680 RepID=A0A839XV07_9PSEU|nr:hypothetical protein [Prauserella sediminis]MBB3663655.1 hypothetical protein [Prauserella sediminis]